MNLVQQIVTRKKLNLQTMANIEKFIPILLRLEGGFVNDPLDHGGATNMGITLTAWRSMGYDCDADGDIDADDLKLLNKDDFRIILKNHFWDCWLLLKT